METQPNFEFLCRVCAANTKGKNSVAECVYILKTPSLKDKVEKYLYLSISETDILPKVLCKTCFRQVEATASLSKIAKHTQKVFRDFLLCTKPGTSQHDYNSIDIEAKSDSPPASSAGQTAASTTTTTTTMPKLTVRKDEVVVNVSITDPLTRENSHKILHATQRRQNSVDAKFTPKSIAQRGLTSTPKAVPSCTSIIASPKKSSPAGVINFVRPPVSTSSQTQPQSQQVTTFTSGGYIIGRVATPAPTGGVAVVGGGARPSSETSNVLQQKRRNLKMALNNIRASAMANSTGQVSLLKSSQRQLQVKPSSELEISRAEAGEEAKDAAAEEPFVKKSTSPQMPESQPPQAAERSQATGIPEDVVLGRVIKDADLLKLILKALKWPVTKQTLDAQMQRLKSSKFLDVMSDPNLLQDMDLTQILGPYLAPVLLAAQAIQQQQIAAVATANNTPPTTATTPPQQQQHHQSPSSSESSSVVGLENAIPYKLPAGTSVQLVPATAEDEEEAEAEQEAAMAMAMAKKSKPEKRPYSQFLPPKKVRKTSYRTRDSLIVISDEEEVQQDADYREATATRRFSKSSPDVASSTATAPHFRVDIDPSFLSQFGIGVAGSGVDSSNDALLALLNRQRAALCRLQRGQRRRRSNTNLLAGASAPFDVDDFVLVEPSTTPPEEEEDDGEDQPSQNESADDSSSNPASASSSVGQLMGAAAAFPVPVQVSMPLITRPIIKRRKTVIQASPGRTNIAATTTAAASTITTTSLATTATSTTSQFVVPTAPPKTLQRQASDSSSVSTVNTIATQVPSTVISIATQVPSTDSKLALTATAKISTATTTTTTSATKLEATSDPQLELKSEGGNPSSRGYGGGKKVNPSKSALGQQLLEAIGLQKVQSQTTAACDEEPDNNNKDDDDNEVDESKAQLSLERSRRQKQLLARKQEEPTVADADSTTKSVVKEVLVEAKHKHAPAASTSDIDIEEQIDKIALVVQNTAKQPRQSQATRIPEIRRRSTLGNRSRKSTSLLLDSKKENSELNTIEEVKEDSDTKLQEKATESTQTDDDEQEQEMQEGDDGDDGEEAENLDQSTSTTTTYSVHINENISSSDANSGKESTTSMSPRKRGRKRNEDKDPDFVEPGRRDQSGSASSQRSRGAGRGRAAAIVAKQRVREIETDSSRTKHQEEDTESVTSIKRPARVSKTLSKYYKGPDQPPLATRRSQTSTGRVTRNR